MATALTIDYPIEGIDAEIGFNTQSQTEIAIVTYDVAPVSGIEAINAANFIVGMRHRFMLWLSAEDSITANPMSSGREWEITVTYSSQGTTDNPSDQEDDFKTIIEPFNWTYTKVITNDKETGEPIENPAGDPYDPPFMAIVPNLGWRITLRETTANVGRVPLIGYVNDTQFTMLSITVPKYCAQISDYRPMPQYDDDGNLYFLNMYEIKLNFARDEQNILIGFRQETLSAGFNQLKVASDKTMGKTRLRGADLEPLDLPQKIGANGKVTDTAFYQQWTINDLTGFTQFGLPTNYPSFQNG